MFRVSSSRNMPLLAPSQTNQEYLTSPAVAPAILGSLGLPIFIRRHTPGITILALVECKLAPLRPILLLIDYMRRSEAVVLMETS